MLFDALAPLLVTNLSAPWSDQVHSVDASFWGLGVCSSHVSIEAVKSIGRHAERWRFQSEQNMKATEVLENWQGSMPTPRNNSHVLTSQVSQLSDCFHDLLCSEDESYQCQSQAPHAFKPVPLHVVNRS